ncbi:AGAP004372-PA-like protein [Anopheles sinensis]|uniref:Elongation of very long chain fatty acids protein n=1 Tax=Anopheles sinensis TaxID=74873 RepID=A0A084WTG1_ANOSI|nr:AGAP004372-PA-like protein [Anopheles sinensis]
MLNSFVHIVMYFYYMVAALGPKYQKYIWWKKYLTAFQMCFACTALRVDDTPLAKGTVKELAVALSLFAIFTHPVPAAVLPTCDYPKGFMVWIGLHGVMFLFLFSDFYKQAYNKRVGRAKRERKR